MRVSSGRRDLLPPAHSLLPRPHRGISLLEILIAMFILLVGLMGAASLFPVGSHYAAQSDRYDRGAALSAAAFDELLARGILQPQHWLYGDAKAIPATETKTLQVINPNTNNFNISVTSARGILSGRAFVIDPIGVASAVNAGLYQNNQYFPQSSYLQSLQSGGPIPNIAMPGSWNTAPAVFPNPANWPITENAWPIRRVSIPGVNPLLPMPLPVADTIFSLHDSLSVELPKEDDQPARQRWRTLDPNGTPDIYTDDTLLRRDYAADYTWLATVVPVSVDGLAAMQPASRDYGDKYYDVSVAVFYKREETPSPTSERLLQAALLPGGEVELIGPDLPTLDKALEDLRPNQWIALAGVNPTNGAFLMKWYRLLSLDEEAFQENGGAGHTHVVRRAMLDGPNWPQTPGATEIDNLTAIILPGIVSVTTRSMKLQQE